MEYFWHLKGCQYPILLARVLEIELCENQTIYLYMASSNRHKRKYYIDDNPPLFHKSAESNNGLRCRRRNPSKMPPKTEPQTFKMRGGGISNIKLVVAIPSRKFNVSPER